MKGRTKDPTLVKKQNTAFTLDPDIIEALNRAVNPSQSRSNIVNEILRAALLPDTFRGV